MSIISKLIIKEWFKVLLAAFVVLTLLISTADIINGFLRGKSFAIVMVEFILKMPELWGRMIPVTCLIATLLSFNRLKSKSELIAIFATGYSFSRVYQLLIFCSFIISLLQFANLGFIEPYANKIERQKITKSQTSEGEFLTRSVVDGGRFWYKTPFYFASFTVFNREKKSLMEPSIYRYNKQHLANEIISAKEAVYEPNGNKWLFKDGNKLHELDATGFPNEENFKESYIPLNEKPEDFLEFDADLTTLPFNSLFLFIQRIKKTGININDYEVMLYQKISLSLVCIVFALIPLSTIFNPNRRSDSFGKSVVFTLVFSILFWLLFSLSASSGQAGKIPALLATFMVPFFFSFYVIFNYFKYRKLSF